jgi:hypothetical protein
VTPAACNPGRHSGAAGGGGSPLVSPGFTTDGKAAEAGTVPVAPMAASSQPSSPATAGAAPATARYRRSGTASAPILRRAVAVVVFVVVALAVVDLVGARRAGRFPVARLSLGSGDEARDRGHTTGIRSPAGARAAARRGVTAGAGAGHPVVARVIGAGR